MLKIKSFFYKSAVQVLSLKKHKDKRGFLYKILDQNIIKDIICDIYISKSKKNVFRGLHYNKLEKDIRYYSCIEGELIHYFVDTRVRSKTYGICKSYKNTSKNIIIKLLPGIAHGVYTLKNNTLLLYLSSKRHDPKNEKLISYRDAGIRLPRNVIISNKDKADT